MEPICETQKYKHRKKYRRKSLWSGVGKYSYLAHKSTNHETKVENLYFKRKLSVLKRTLKAQYSYDTQFNISGWKF